VKTALIVEDAPEISQWLAQTARLAFPSLKTQCVSYAKEALAQLQAHPFDLVLVDLGLPDGSGVDVLTTLRQLQPSAVGVVVTIYDDDEHLFPALQAGAFGYLLKEEAQEELIAQLLRITRGDPPLSPAIARRMIMHFAQAQNRQSAPSHLIETGIALSGRENDVLMRVSKGFTLIEISTQLSISRYTVADHVKQIYRKLGISSRAEATLEAVRRGIVN
jgi:DNA-binding NarL/FixJ family response regulator